MLLPPQTGWGVVGQQDQDLGVVGGGEAHEGHHHLAGDGGLRGARLAADGVARLAGILAGALLGHHHAGEDLPALVAGLLADHLPHHGGLRVLHYRAVGGRHRLDHIGLEQLAAVDGSGEGCDHLDGGDGESLTEGAYRQVHAGHVNFLPDIPILFSIQIDICRLLQSESLEILIKLFDAQPLADLHKGRVAGVLHRLGQGLGAVARRLFGAADRLWPALHHVIAGAVEGIAL